jgi:hypothetical protein
MGLIDTLKQALKAGRGKRRQGRPSTGKRAARSDVGNLPGGASAKEASEASPQRAAELAD